jgi:hypothetical protein
MFSLIVCHERAIDREQRYPKDPPPPKSARVTLAMVAAGPVVDGSIQPTPIAITAPNATPVTVPVLAHTRVMSSV